MQRIKIPSQADALCLLGLEGLDCSQCLEWLDTQHDLYLVDNLSDLQIPPEVLNHPRLRSFSIETPLQHEQVIKEIAWHAVMQSMHIHSQPGWEEFRRRLEECQYAAHLLLSEVADFGQEAFGNARSNWRQSGPFRSWALLKGRFQDVPAIVCGAGPSLKEAAPRLAALSSRALILSAGTAGSIMGSWGIAPHLACFLDKQTPLDSILQQPFLEVPSILQSRLNPACVHWMHGEKILAPESGPLPWEKWWMDDDYSPSFGWTVGNFATQMAVWMGCNPIIWVGMDLCYQGEQKYADRSDRSQVPLIESNDRMTQRDWLLAARWSEELSCEHPQLRFVNTSMQGLPLRLPIETMPLDAIDQTLTREFDLTGRLHQAIQGASSLTMTIQQKEAEWVMSWERCIALCSQMTSDGDDALSNEIVHEFYLEPLWRIWRPLFNREARGQNLDWHRLLFFQQVLQNGQI